jgi:hypothetical protein
MRMHGTCYFFAGALLVETFMFSLVEPGRGIRHLILVLTNRVDTHFYLPHAFKNYSN